MKNKVNIMGPTRKGGDRNEALVRKFAQIDEDTFKEMQKIRDETGLPISRQIDLKMKGYKIVK